MYFTRNSKSLHAVIYIVFIK